MSLVIAEQPAPQPTGSLWRGIVVPAADLGSWLYKAPLVPGTRAENEVGEATVLDGNELGVYMSDNVAVAEDVHGLPHHGDRLPDSPTFTLGSLIQQHVELA